MNERFVCVKVDREERPDIDAICMEACQAITGHGGWPLNAFLTPDGRAVLRGHLLPARIPPRAAELADGARRRRRRLVDAARPDHSPGRAAGRGAQRDAPGSSRRSSRSPRSSSATRSSRCGARTTAPTVASVAPPKFPQASVIELLLARGEREMSLGTLEAMARGGIYDQVGGGFARYSVDATWTVPHFEKMLYDNALLARAYLHGWQVSGERAVPAGVLRDARLGAARDARSRGRLLLGARRRLRGRRGQVLRVDGRGAPRGPRRALRRRDRVLRAEADSNTVRSSKPTAPNRRASPRSGAGCSRCDRSASGLDSTTSA